MIWSVKPVRRKSPSWVSPSSRAQTTCARARPWSLIAQLQEEGAEIVAYDPAIQPGPHITKQFDYMRYAAPHLKNVVDGLADFMQETPEDAARDADVIVVTQKLPELRSVLRSKKEEAPVVDLVRISDEARNSSHYIGIGW